MMYVYTYIFIHTKNDDYKYYNDKYDDFNYSIYTILTKYYQLYLFSHLNVLMTNQLENHLKIYN